MYLQKPSRYVDMSGFSFFTSPIPLEDKHVVFFSRGFLLDSFKKIQQINQNIQPLLTLQNCVEDIQGLELVWQQFSWILHVWGPVGPDSDEKFCQDSGKNNEIQLIQ